MAQTVPYPMPDGKDPNETLDFTIDLTRELVDRPTGTTDNIASVVWTVPVGVNNVQVAHDNTKATIWLSGGTLGTTYVIDAVITTSASPTPRVYERSFSVTIIQK